MDAATILTLVFSGISAAGVVYTVLTAISKYWSERKKNKRAEERRWALEIGDVQPGGFRHAVITYKIDEDVPSRLVSLLARRPSHMKLAPRIFGALSEGDIKDWHPEVDKAAASLSLDRFLTPLDEWGRATGGSHSQTWFCILMPVAPRWALSNSTKVRISVVTEEISANRRTKVRTVNARPTPWTARSADNAT